MSCSLCKRRSYLWMTLFSILEFIEDSIDDQHVKELTQLRFSAVRDNVNLSINTDHESMGYTTDEIDKFNDTQRQEVDHVD